MKFTKRNPNIIDFMYDITPILTSNFYDDKYSLEYYFDPEIQNYEYICLNIEPNNMTDDSEILFEKVLNFDMKLNEPEKYYEINDKFIVDIN